MKRWRFTPQAEEDLFDIWQFVAQDNLEAANHLEQAILGACEILASTPLAGAIRAELTRLPLRFWIVQPYSNYFIAYKPTETPIQIVRIFHAARDVKNVFG
jgi:plasmid stabilization system protein ParE